MKGISVLMSFYGKDNPSYLNAAFESIFLQALQPIEVVLVQDGEVDDELARVVQFWEKKIPIKKFVFRENKGLGFCLNFGLSYCKCDIVARMDADDISSPERFQKQYQFLIKNPEISAVSSWIAEFDGDFSNIKTYRKLPAEHSELKTFAKSRCPLNHPAVMFRKEDVLRVGNYDPYKNQQDYQLWVRLIMEGYKIANIPEPLLFMRVNNDLYDRRGGIEYLKIEYSVQKEFLRMGFISNTRFFNNLMIRSFVRLIPNRFRKFLYLNLLRK